MTALDASANSRLDEPSLFRQLLSPNPLDLVPRVALLLLLPHEINPWLLLAVPLLALAMLEKRIYRHPLLWFAIAAVQGVNQWIHWHGIDDHVVLVTYLALALASALSSPDPLHSLRTSARLLVGLVMGFATTWKLTSGEFLDARFFEHTLLSDPRFEPFARWLGGLDAGASEANRAAIAQFNAWNIEPTAIELASTTRIGWLALALTIGTIVVEGWLAVAWLGPTERYGRWRTPSLIAFCFTTYLIVPVVLFGLVLLVLAYGTTEAHVQRHAILATMVGLLALGPLWTQVTGVQL